jgi:mono/diheme cytochrome c family protein
MRERKLLVASGLALASVALVSGQASGPQRPTPTPTPVAAVSTQRAVLDRYCVGCHNERTKTANLLLDRLDLARLGEHAAEAETGRAQARAAGMMPPEGMPKPDPAIAEALIGWLENELDRTRGGIPASAPARPAPPQPH